LRSLNAQPQQQLFSQDERARSYVVDHIIGAWLSELYAYKFLKDKGKMFGVLLGTWLGEDTLPQDVSWVNKDKKLVSIRAYSGQMNGVWMWPSWAPSLLAHHRIAGESWRVQYALHTLTQQINDPIQQRTSELINQLRQQRSSISRQHAQTLREHTYLYALNGDVRRLSDCWSTAATGVGECCAPKLICRAAQLKIKPIGLAEFWCGPHPKTPPAELIETRALRLDLISEYSSKISWADSLIELSFYAPCKERCLPLMPFLLNELSNS
jgi:hypothetical protein